jgi:signal peptidase I
VFVVGLFVVSLALSLIVNGWLLRLGARCARIPDVTFARALVVVMVFSIVGVTCNMLVAVSGWKESQPEVAFAAFLSAMVATWLIVQRGLRTTFGRAVLAWLPTLAGSLVAFTLVIFFVQPFVLQTFVIPTGGMAPTIIGDHYIAPCPHCDGELLISADPSFPPVGSTPGICDQCLRVSEAIVSDTQVIPGDCILSLKFLQPRRWDVVTFRYPADPSTLYVMRIVGLPGEKIAIRDGEVGIDGRIAEKPQAIADLTYLASPEMPWKPEQAEWGPAQLAEDEYFVLGDFSRNSADSRVWQQGAPGHHAYAVPQSYLDGMVTHIYWPPSRWRVFR